MPWGAPPGPGEGLLSASRGDEALASGRWLSLSGREGTVDSKSETRGLTVRGRPGLRCKMAAPGSGTRGGTGVGFASGCERSGTLKAEDAAWRSPNSYEGVWRMHRSYEGV